MTKAAPPTSEERAVDHGVKATFPASDPAAMGGTRGHVFRSTDATPVDETPGIELPAVSADDCIADEIQGDRTPFFVHDADRLRAERDTQTEAVARVLVPMWVSISVGIATAFGVGLLVGRSLASRRLA